MHCPLDLSCHATCALSPFEQLFVVLQSVQDGRFCIYHKLMVVIYMCLISTDAKRRIYDARLHERSASHSTRTPRTFNFRGFFESPFQRFFGISTRQIVCPAIACAPVPLDAYRHALLMTQPLLLMINDLLSSRLDFNGGVLPFLVSVICISKLNAVVPRF
jgi:hypothetical protein